MKRFGELLFEAIDDTIGRVLGESASVLIYELSERQIKVKREEIHRNIEVFFAYLEKLLGPEGAQVIQFSSLKRLCLKLQREYEDVETYFSFLDRLYEAKFELLASMLKEEHSVCN